MPFIEEEKFKLIQEDLDNSKLQRENAENELTSTQEEFSAFKRSSRGLSIFLGLLLGIASGAAYYFYAYGGNSAINNVDIESVKKQEAYRVLDSISRANARAARSGDAEISNIDIETATNEIAEETRGETIYSVQIGVLSNNQYPLLSSKVIPSIVANADGYFKYSLGLFLTLEEARELKKELIKLGFEDAFIASYINGERQQIHN
ncbi:hypothetical protein [Tenacibaculum sp. L6]|uniref:hypothetical protein n=1 Tax=Tenacibaculum sp. L6 TaxID=2992764 RepID=UPI00237AD8BF|nr:hypothetical protein [Tenacibaculum sp. L6]MDE0535078.1 hypothetical protein [Tenacibaculum sp. L6]